MSRYIIIIFALLLIALIGKSKPVMVIYLKRLVLPILCAAFIICLIIFSKTAVNSAFRGIKLWLEIVFPSLFPFFVGSELLNKTGVVRALGILMEPIMRPLFNVPGCGSFALAMGVTSGYPVGAKITASMREEKLLSKIEAERLLTFTNNSGPLFIIGAVSVGMFNIPGLGLFLLCCHILACITVGLIFKFYGRNKDVSHYRYEKNIFRRFKQELVSKKQTVNLGNVFGDAVRNSVNMMLAIGGFIIFFSVIINLLLETGFIHNISNVISVMLSPFGINREVITAVISGFFEITTGTNMASKATNIPLIQQLTAASMIIGWAGLSVHSQVFSIISSTDISIKPYLLGKFLQGIISGIYTYISIKIAGLSFSNISPAFVPHQVSTPIQWHIYLLDSCANLFAAFVILTLLALASVSFSYVLRKQKIR